MRHVRLKSLSTLKCEVEDLGEARLKLFQANFLSNSSLNEPNP